MLRSYYGLDDPISVQYMRYIKSVFSFDFGPSLKYPSRSVTDIIIDGFPISALIGFEALFFALPIGMLFGSLAAIYHHKIQDTCIGLGAAIGVSIPSFVMATGLQFLFAIVFPIFPIARWGTSMHTILPALSLSIGPACIIARLLRASTLEVLHKQYIHTAYCKGLSQIRVLRSHVWKNSILPILSYLGPLTTNVLLGSFIVEKVFAIPGLGQWFVNGVLNRDYPVIGGLTLFYSMVLLCNHTVIDFLLTVVDPRIQEETR